MIISIRLSFLTQTKTITKGANGIYQKNIMFTMSIIDIQLMAHTHIYPVSTVNKTIAYLKHRLVDLTTFLTHKKMHKLHPSTTQRILQTIYFMHARIHKHMQTGNQTRAHARGHWKGRMTQKTLSKNEMRKSVQTHLKAHD